MTTSTAFYDKLPKYVRLGEELRAQIVSGALKPGDKLPTVSQIRAQHGVSVTTLDKVLTSLEQDGLITRTQGSGVFVAPPRKKAATGTIGILTGVESGQLQPPYWAHLQAGIQRAAREAGLEVLLLNGDDVKWEKIDGVLTTDLARLQKTPSFVPRVTLILASPDTCAVTSDDRAGGVLATQHLIELGHRNIACLTLRNHPVAQARVEGYKHALRQAKIKPRAAWMHVFDDLAESGRGGIPFLSWGYETMSHWLQNGWGKLGCTAIFAHNDEAAIGVMRALREAKIRVPQDVSVVGYDGTEVGEYYHPRLTSVAVPLEEIGRRGVEMLLGQMQHADGAPRQNLVLPISLKVRESCVPPRYL